MRSFLICLLLVPMAAVASPLPDYPFVYVFGIATKEIAPDKAIITVRVKSYDPQAERAYSKQSEIAEALIAFTTRLGLPTDAIVAQAIEKTAVRREDDKGKELEIIGYEAVRMVKIDVQNLVPFSELIEFLYRQPNIESISAEFGRKDDRLIMQDLTDEACRRAKEDATRLAKGFEKKLGQVRAISEGGFSDLGNPFVRGELSYAASAASLEGKKDFRVVPATITFRKGVYAIFALE